MIAEREVARGVAMRGGYWWLRCALCGRPFAAFEQSRDGLLTEPGRSEGTCSRPVCVARAGRLNLARRESWEAGISYLEYAQRSPELIALVPRLLSIGDR